MNTPHNIEQTRQRLERIAEQYTPPAKARRQALLEPFTESIRILREKGASLSAITSVLKTEHVQVSRFVVGRFCRQHFGDTLKPKRRRGRPAANPPPPPTTANTPPALINHAIRLE